MEMWEEVDLFLTIPTQMVRYKLELFFFWMGFIELLDCIKAHQHEAGITYAFTFLNTDSKINYYGVFLTR